MPTTGYVTNSAGLFNDAYLAQYGCSVATFSTACPCNICATGELWRQTTLASPDLKPEKSRSITLGAVFQPIRNASLSVDYFNIKKTDAITSLSSGLALSGLSMPAIRSRPATRSSPTRRIRPTRGAAARGLSSSRTMLNANTQKVGRHRLRARTDVSASVT